MYYVYILESTIDGDYYKGSTSDYKTRLEQHNRGESQYTKTRIPWIMIFVREFESKREALIEGKRLKKCNRTYLNWLIQQPFNLLNK